MWSSHIFMNPTFAERSVYSIHIHYIYHRNYMMSSPFFHKFNHHFSGKQTLLAAPCSESRRWCTELLQWCLRGFKVESCSWGMVPDPFIQLSKLIRENKSFPYILSMQRHVFSPRTINNFALAFFFGKVLSTRIDGPACPRDWGWTWRHRQVQSMRWEKHYNLHSHGVFDVFSTRQSWGIQVWLAWKPLTQRPWKKNGCFVGMIPKHA